MVHFLVGKESIYFYLPFIYFTCNHAELLSSFSFLTSEEKGDDKGILQKMTNPRVACVLLREEMTLALSVSQSVS